MKRLFGLLSLGALLSAPAVFGFQPTSDASGVSPRVLVFGTIPAGGLTAPNTNIKLASSGVPKYKPNSLTGTGLSPGEGCGDSTLTFIITNETTKTQKITLGSLAFGKIPAGDEAGVCLSKSKKTWVFGLARSPSAALTVHVT